MLTFRNHVHTTRLLHLFRCSTYQSALAVTAVYSASSHLRRKLTRRLSESGVAYLLQFRDSEGATTLSDTSRESFRQVAQLTDTSGTTPLPEKTLPQRAAPKWSIRRDAGIGDFDISGRQRCVEGAEWGRAIPASQQARRGKSRRGTHETGWQTEGILNHLNPVNLMNNRLHYIL